LLNFFFFQIYVFLWFWFVILAAITGVRIIMRGLEASLAIYRTYQLRRNLHDRREAYWVNAIVSRTGLSDWFIVREVKKHMNPVLYTKFLRM
jgi:hypothetical protein